MRRLSIEPIGLPHPTASITTSHADLDPIIVPTVGFATPIKRQLFGLNVVFFDLGGGARIRGVWPNYFADVHGVVYVVDAADPNRIAESSDELHAALMHPMVVGKPVLMSVP